jgi:hypothetical protein
MLGPYINYSIFESNTVFGLRISIYVLFFISFGSLLLNIINKHNRKNVTMFSRNIYLFWQLIECLQIFNLISYLNIQMTY